MSAEDADRLKVVLSGTALAMVDGPVACHRGRIAFTNSGGMLAHPDGVYGDTRVICDVDIYLAGEMAIAVASMGSIGRNVLGRVTVAKGQSAEVEPVINLLLSGRGDFTEYFEKLYYQHPGQH